MGIRKNAKFLTPAEKENFAKACVLMKAQIVNPAAPAAQRKWDQYAAIHWMIQDAFAPGDSFVNFGHGGNGSFKLPELAPLLPLLRFKTWPASPSPILTIAPSCKPA